MSSFSTNILILGKIGAGKASLVNYLYSQEIAVSRSLRPAAAKGLHYHKPFSYKDINIVIWDTWGLEADKAQEAARALFGKGQNTDNMPSTELTQDDLTDGEIGILDLLSKCGLIPSKKEGRRLIEQGGISVDDEKITDVEYRITPDMLEGDGLLIRKGKKSYHRLVAKK